MNKVKTLTNKQEKRTKKMDSIKLTNKQERRVKDHLLDNLFAIFHQNQIDDSQGEEITRLEGRCEQIAGLFCDKINKNITDKEISYHVLFSLAEWMPEENNKDMHKKAFKFIRTAYKNGF